jgi:energy-coupling factor transporter transmembrane protein EcfT
MKIIKTILDKPYLVILIAAIITLVSPNKYFLYSIGIISVVFSISIIYSIVQKKWLRLVLSCLSYIVFFILWMVFVFFKGYSDDVKPQIEISDSKFYANEILKSTNLKLPNGIKIIAKLDTIVYTGIENEYDAECLYVGTEKIMIELENSIISRKDFIKVSELEKYPTRVLTQNNFNLNELKSVYKKESEGSFIIFIAFDKSYSKFYYSALYY